MERTGEHSLTLTLDGGETCTASFNFVRLKRRTLPKSSVATVGGDVLRPRQSTPYRIDYRVPANGRIVLSWT